MVRPQLTYANFVMIRADMITQMHGKAQWEVRRDASQPLEISMNLRSRIRKLRKICQIDLCLRWGVEQE
jgi:hypothetical protein